MKGLAQNDPGFSRELLPFYEEANSNQRGRHRRGRPYEKGAFARYCLRLEFECTRKFLRPPPLTKLHKTRAAEKLDSFFDRLANGEPDLAEDLFNLSVANDGKRSMARYIKRRNLEDARVKRIWHSDPEMIQLEEKGEQLEFIEDELEQIKGIGSLEVDPLFHELAEIPFAERRRLVIRLKEFRRRTAHRAKIYEYVRGRMRSKEDAIKLREIHRRFSIRSIEFNPILAELAANRLVIWDKKEKTVRINSYDPKNKKRFTWLGESSWPISPFEPYLEKGRIYKARDFREDVLEGWMKAGNALFISG